MNKRIKELAVQAKLHMVSEPRLEEFATLIVQECMRIAMDWDDVQLAVEMADLFEIKEPQ